MGTLFGRILRRKRLFRRLCLFRRVRFVGRLRLIRWKQWGLKMQIDEVTSEREVTCYLPCVVVKKDEFVLPNGRQIMMFLFLEMSYHCHKI